MISEKMKGFVAGSSVIRAMFEEGKRLASIYGADKVYDFIWTGNFSDARNFSFSKATCEYIYSADADEVLDEENREKFIFSGFTSITKSFVSIKSLTI